MLLHVFVCWCLGGVYRSPQGTGPREDRGLEGQDRGKAREEVSVARTAVHLSTADL